MFLLYIFYKDIHSVFLENILMWLSMFILKDNIFEKRMIGYMT